MIQPVKCYVFSAVPRVGIAIDKVDPKMDALLIKGSSTETAILPVVQKGQTASNALNVLLCCISMLSLLGLKAL